MGPFLRKGAFFAGMNSSFLIQNHYMKCLKLKSCFFPATRYPASGIFYLTKYFLFCVNFTYTFVANLPAKAWTENKL